MSTTPDNMPTPPDWKIGELYDKSWEIVKKNKVLWIFGMAVAGFVGSGSNFNTGNSNTKSIERLFNPQASPVPQTDNVVSQVLGTATSNSGSNFLSSIFSNIPVGFYVLLGIEILGIVVVAIVISFIARAWANAALIHATQDALSNKAVTIRDSSEKAFANIKSLVGFSLIVTALIIAAVLAMGIIVALGFVASPVLGGIAIALVIIGAIIFLLLFTLAGIWGQFLIVLDKISAWESFKRGLNIAKRKFWASLLLGIVNTVLSLFVLGIPLAILIGIIAGAIFGAVKNQGIVIPLIVIGIIIFVAFIIGYTLLGGVVTAFKTSVWQIAYTKIRRKYDGK